MLNKIIWFFATIMLIYSGIYFTIKLKGIQFNFKKMFLNLLKKENSNISPIQTLMLSTAAKIGVGSIAGIALAIYIGGEGTIFWIWITSLLIAPNSFVESVLGSQFKKLKNGIYQGGPSYYIKYGLNDELLSYIYALLIIIVYILCFSSIQSNTITTSIIHSYSLNKIFIALIITIISGIVIFKDVKELIKIISSIVPFMCILYIGVGIFIILKNIDMIPSILTTIISKAFNFKSFSSGFLTSFIIGIQRGIFSNEAGIGTSAIATASSDTSNHYKQGYIQLLGIYFTSLIICTISAFIVLTSPYKEIILNNVNGIEISLFALKHHIGCLGEIFLIICIILFAFSTIIAGYYYGESSLKFILKNITDKGLFIFKIITLIIIFLGCLISATSLWNISDAIIGLLSIINIYAIIKLYKKNKL